ncbi:MAG TPA: hypothetical protein VGZ22_01565 [Isosphaeraceae bacterium]|jgi:hypothetical protein|nr:hypothetical protein [Isosphaeraceae bacterium]
MNARSSSLWCAVAFGLVVILGSSAPAKAADAAGTWKWTVERNGNTIENTLKLKQDGEKLTGTIAQQDNETEIMDGKVSGETVSFKVTREFGGNKILFTYSGKLSGDTIKGEVKVERDGETMTRDWEAKRSK